MSEETKTPDQELAEAKQETEAWKQKCGILEQNIQALAVTVKMQAKVFASG